MFCSFKFLHFILKNKVIMIIIEFYMSHKNIGFSGKIFFSRGNSALLRNHGIFLVNNVKLTVLIDYFAALTA